MQLSLQRHWQPCIQGSNTSTTVYCPAEDATVSIILSKCDSAFTPVRAMTGDLYQISIKIPFPTEREAEIAYDVLRVDPEPKRSFITKQINRDGKVLIVDFAGELAKNVRVGLTSFFQSLILCCETIKEFKPPAEKYDHY